MTELKKTISVITLNCWGIPFVSKNRKERMAAIAAYLSQGLHDIVCLQEVWDIKDFHDIKTHCSKVLPYSHYFHSGVFGSGLCTFSRWPIAEVFFHAWALNGYVHMVHHGDWFGGKGVGLCRIKCENLMINVYSAHLHAEYSTKDIYLGHRVLQAFDTAEFIKLTSLNADLIILAGDLNTQPTDLAYKVICETDRLTDSMIEFNSTQSDDKKITLGTNERATNCYSIPAEAALQPEGKRIDYVLYHAGLNYLVDVISYDMPISGFVPDCKFSYSDHEAVAVKMCVTKKENPDNWTRSAEYVETLSKSLVICKEALDALTQSARKYLIYGFSILVFLLSTVGMAETTAVDIPRLLLVVVMIYFFFMGTLWNCMEWNGVIAGRNAMSIILDDLLEKN